MMFPIVDSIVIPVKNPEKALSQMWMLLFAVPTKLLLFTMVTPLLANYLDIRVTSYEHRIAVYLNIRRYNSSSVDHVPNANTTRHAGDLKAPAIS